MWPKGNGRPVRPSRGDLASLKRCYRVVFLVSAINTRIGRPFDDADAEELWASMRRLPREEQEQNIAELEERLANTPGRRSGTLQLELT